MSVQLTDAMKDEARKKAASLIQDGKRDGSLENHPDVILSIGKKRKKHKQLGEIRVEGERVFIYEMFHW